MPSVYLALGSNLGDREQSIHKAIQALKKDGVSILKVSSIIETDPVGPLQDKFLNAVLKGKTQLSPEELLEVIQSVERKLGRVRKIINGPRTIDIDILLYDDIKLVSRRLIIPHPRMMERSFVLEPLKEVDPALCESLKI